MVSNKSERKNGALKQVICKYLCTHLSVDF